MRRVNPKHYSEEYYLTDASGYDEFKISWGKILEPRLSRIAKEIPSVYGRKVLDIGCGRGELAFWSARNGAKEVVGIDYSRNAIKLANEAKKHYSRAVQKKVTFKIGDAKNLRFKNNGFEVVILTEVLEHLYPEEQLIVFQQIRRILTDGGFVFIHAAPSKWFNDFTYRFWCYPLSTINVGVNNLMTNGDYGNLDKPLKIRTRYHKIMHVNEPNYFSLKRIFKESGFEGKIRSTNITINKPEITWKDKLFNFLVFLYPLSKNVPFNILWGNDYFAVLRKK